ncbi:MAG TPA: PKD domain-containing protein [Methanoregulaceae archaeon]|nr:PKD domain-containing protein [Methanoregulaceae archaeon]
MQTISPTLPTPTALPSPVPTPISTPGNPEARFTASPRTGPLPLTVIFLDLSSGVPDSWAWEFGDGGSSEEQNPVHTYTETGTFSVSLQVKNIEGAHTRIMQEYVNVTPAQVLDVAVSAETEGFIRPDGFAQFSVTGPGSRIKIGGQVIRPETGDTIMLILEREGKGSISIIDGQIVDFSFDNILLYQNGKIVTSGYLSEIFIPSSASFLSTFVLEIPPSQGEYRIKVEGVTEILQGNEKGILVMHLQPDRSGMMLLDTSLPYSVQYRGGAVSISY